MIFLITTSSHCIRRGSSDDHFFAYKTCFIVLIITTNSLLSRQELFYFLEDYHKEITHNDFTQNSLALKSQPVLVL